MEVCNQHQVIATDMAIIKTDIKYIKDKVCTHITQGEERGGFRDRLIIVEQEISALKKMAWIRLIVAGFIGGMLGNVAPETIQLLSQWIIAK